MEIEKTINNQETKEVKSRIEALDQIASNLKIKLEKAYGMGGNNPMDYHNPEHSIGISKESVRTLRGLLEIDPNLIRSDYWHDPEEIIKLMEVLSLAHDLFQAGSVTKNGMWCRFRGMASQRGNERASAEWLVKEMAKYKINGQNAFTDLNLKNKHGLGRWIITQVLATYPEFELNASLSNGVKGLKIYQPLLNPEEISESKKRLKVLMKRYRVDLGLVGELLAHFDLRYPWAIADSREAMRCGDAEFRELNHPGMIPIVEAVSKNEFIDNQVICNLAKKMMDWWELQPGFAKWQKELLIKSLDNSPEINKSAKSKVLKNAIRQKFGILADGSGNFENNIKAAEERYRNLLQKYGVRLDNIDKKTFLEMLIEMGYKKILNISI